MKYSNSPLISGEVDLTKNSNIRKNKTYNPSGKITKITPHHMAGKMKAEDCAKMHAKGNTSSANYYIGYDGEIVLGVPEDRRAWTSSSRENDYNAVTIEVSNNMNGAPWSISDISYKSLVTLCTDICVRNGIEKLVYTGDDTGNLTAHRFFTATECPGDYLFARFPMLADHVNKNLSAGQITLPETPTYYYVKAGDTLYSICKTYGADIKEVAQLNNIDNINILYVGQRLEIPKPKDDKPQYYTVKKGDTVTRICFLYKISKDDFKAFNPGIKNINLIYPGQKVRVS